MMPGVPRSPWTMPVIGEALELRALGMPYASIAIALNYYYGFTATADAVRHMLRRHGATPDNRRGSMTGLRRAA